MQCSTKRSSHQFIDRISTEMDLFWKICICAIWFATNACSTDVLTALVDETVLLPCHVTLSSIDTSSYVIEWSRQHDDVPLLMKFGKHLSTNNPQFTGRVNLQGESATLRIQRLKLSDDGWYQCRILYLDDQPTRNGSWQRLIVNAPPTFKSTPPLSVEGRKGGSLKLRCRVAGKPEPEITWRKDGWTLQNEEDGLRIEGETLDIQSLTISHRGNYQCYARNAEGEVDHTTIVQVAASPQTDVKPRNVTVKRGQDAYFSCKASGYPTDISYKWFYNGSDVSDVESLRGRTTVTSDGTFVISKVKKSDRGRVGCQAINSYGPAPLASAFLIVQYPAYVGKMPSLVYGGQTLSLTLHCNAYAEPPVSTVTWRKNDQILTTQKTARVHESSAKDLKLSSIQFTDEGVYSCTPYNALGTSGESTAVRVLVKEPPRFVLRPKSDFELEIGSALHAACIGTGDPPPRVYWRQISGRERTHRSRRVTWDNGNLTIAYVMKEDHGLWQCVVSNAVSEVTSDVIIKVMHTKPHPVSNVTVVTTFNSATVRWEKGYDGGYPQQFTIWYKRADLGDNSWSTVYADGRHQEAVVKRLEAERVYQFAVLPENVLGKGKFSRTVTVQTQVVPITTTSSPRNAVPRPQGLTYTIDKDGRVVLSWQPDPLFNFPSLLGFLIEFRSLPEQHPMPAKENQRRKKRSLSPLREKRKAKHGSGTAKYFVPREPSKLLSKATARSLHFHERRHRQMRDKLAEMAPVAPRRAVRHESANVRTRKSRSAPVENEQIHILEQRDGWMILGALSANVTSYVIEENRLFRDLLYEFRVLSVSPTDYSEPSTALTVSTQGMTSYGLMSSVLTGNSNKAGMIAGAVVGTVLVLLLIASLAACFISRRRNVNALPKTSFLEEDGESFLAGRKSNSDASNNVSPRRSNDSTPLKVSFAETATAGHSKDDNSKEGVFKRLKTRLGRNKSFDGNKPSSFRKNGSVKRAHSLSQMPPDNVMNRLYQPRDDGLQLLPKSLPKCIPVHTRGVGDTGSQSANRVTPIHRSADGKFHPGKSNSNDLAIERSSSVSRVVSNEATRRQQPRKLRPVSDSFIPRELNRIHKPTLNNCIVEGDENQALEIDCSRSDIEVRLFQAPRAGSRALSPRQYDGSSPSCLDENSFNSSLRNQGFTSPRFHLSRPALTSFCETPPLEQAYPPAEYVYLHDLGLPCPETPASECPSDRDRFSPAVHPMMSLHNPTPAQSPRVTYHQHYAVPGAHYHLSPRCSYSEPHQDHPAGVRWAREKPTSQTITQPGGFYRGPENRRSPQKQAPRPRAHLLPPQVRRLDNNRPNSVAARDPQHRRAKTHSAVRLAPLNDLPESQRLRSTRTTAAIERANSLPAFRPHSTSLPSLSPRRMAPIRDAAPSSDGTQRCSSVDELGSSKGDNDSDRRFSFTSGSASTVRQLPSKESNLCSLDDSPTLRGKALTSLQHERPRSNAQSFSDSSDVSRMSATAQRPLADENCAESSSGYASSQNASSDLSPRVAVMPCSHHACPHTSCDRLSGAVMRDAVASQRDSRASSTESSRSRKDNSSVDDKYEWDSESAMESEVLEALKHFEAHKRNGPVSENLLAELQKYGATSHPLSPADAELLALSSDRNGTPELDNDSPLHESSNSSIELGYSKANIEQRCAALKAEYHEYQRRYQVNDADTVEL